MPSLFLSSSEGKQFQGQYHKKGQREEKVSTYTWIVEHQLITHSLMLILFLPYTINAVKFISFSSTTSHKNNAFPYQSAFKASTFIFHHTVISTILLLLFYNKEPLRLVLFNNSSLSHLL